MPYAIQVDTPHGKRFVGPVYRDKAVAKSWLKFVAAARHCRARVVSREQWEQEQRKQEQSQHGSENL